jgi:hypothetical protein
MNHGHDGLVKLQQDVHKKDGRKQTQSKSMCSQLCRKPGDEPAKPEANRKITSKSMRG